MQIELTYIYDLALKAAVYGVVFCLIFGATLFVSLKYLIEKLIWEQGETNIRLYQLDTLIRERAGEPSLNAVINELHMIYVLVDSIRDHMRGIRE